MLSPSQAMEALRSDCERLDVWQDWKIFLDWEFHACYTGCVVCKSQLDYQGDCLYERRESDSDVGEDGALDRSSFGTSEECFERYGASVCCCTERSERCAFCVFAD